VVTRLILFDIDMTLIRTSGAGRAAVTETFRRLFGIDNPAEGVRFDGRTDNAIFTEIIAVNRLANGDLPAVYERVTEAYLEELPRSLRAKGGIVLPGVVELLDGLARTAAAVGLATGNMRRGAETKLSFFDLWGRFQEGGFGDDTPVRAEMVARGIENLSRQAGCDANPSQCIVIGDTPLDIEAARLAGARAMGVGTGSWSLESLHEAQADFVVADLSDTRSVLEMLLG
jgi:phosphoglycolate phosphatase